MNRSKFTVKEVFDEQLKKTSYTVWDCKYHVVWIPKCRRKVTFGQFRKYMGEVIRALAMQKEGKLEEGHLVLDNIYNVDIDTTKVFCAPSC